MIAEKRAGESLLLTGHFHPADTPEGAYVLYILQRDGLENYGGIMEMTMKLDALLHDIGDVGAGFDLDQFVTDRVNRISKEPPRGNFFDDIYRRGLMDGVALMRVYSQSKGRRRGCLNI